MDVRGSRMGRLDVIQANKEGAEKFSPDTCDERTFSDP